MATKKDTREKKALTVELYAETIEVLTVLGTSDALGGKGTVEDVIVHLAASAADGVRRPDAWERGWVVQAFGSWKGGV